MVAVEGISSIIWEENRRDGFDVSEHQFLHYVIKTNVIQNHSYFKISKDKRKKREEENNEDKKREKKGEGMSTIVVHGIGP